MPVDHYAPCPCGNGKKMKFCKCVDQPQEYEKLVKLIEGGQNLAAVDRINQLLAKTPNAAWLLAIKGELTLSMQELGTFKETAERFLRLKPDNPLALVMRSMVACLEREPVEQSARYLLQGMSESRDALPSLALPAIQLLIRSLASEGKMSMVGYWADLLDVLLGGNEMPEEQSPRAEPSLNLIAKAPPQLVEDPAGVEWKERLAEVLSLTRTFRYDQAETKLRAILRDYPDEPGPLSHLLRAQCAQLDQHGAVVTARKLSEHLGVSQAERAYYRALTMELEPKHVSLQCKATIRYCEVDSEDRVTESLMKLDFVESPSAGSMEDVRRYYAAMVNDEVPAKRVFSILDQPVRQDVQGEERKIASLVGTVVLFGRQTDKPARVLVILHMLAAYEEVIDRLLNELELGEPIPDLELPAGSEYKEFLKRPKVILGKTDQPLSIAERGEQLISDFLQMRVECLDGQTPLQASEEERSRAALQALLCHLEGEQSLVVEAGIIDQIYEKLGLERPALAAGDESQQLKVRNILDLDRINVEDLGDAHLKGLIVRAMSLGASRVFYRCARAVRQRESLQSDHEAQIIALSGLMSSEPGIEEQLEISIDLEQALIAAQAPVGRVIMQRVGLLHSVGRADEAQSVLMEAARKYPEDPYLLSFLQYAMQNQAGQAEGPDLVSKLAQNASQRPAAPESSGNLVLPGQEPPSPTSEGESKLWLPGS